MIKGFRKVELFEWVATLLGVAAAALILGQQSGSTPSAKGLPIADVRDLEQGAKLLDAQRSLPEEVRAAIGLHPEEDDEREEVLKHIRARIRGGGTVPEMLLIAAAIAAAEGEDELSLEALDHMAEHPEALDQFRESVSGLAALARGEPVPHQAALRTQLRGLRASEWLQLRVASKVHARSGRSEDARATRRVAQANAVAFVERYSVLLSVYVTLLGIGVLLVLFWPLVRRALAQHGLTGLGAIPSPFIVSSTQRVFVSWFFGCLIIGSVLTAVGTLVPAAGDYRALAMMIQSLAQGAVAVWLIMRLGRPAGDLLPIAIPLRLAYGKSVRGLAGLALWSAGGLAMGAIAVASAFAVSLMFGAELPESQAALELFSDLDSLSSQIAVAISVTLFAPVFEEILFRGFVYRNLRDLIEPVPAMLVTGLLFGLVHLDLAFMFQLSALGAVLCFAYERSGSLLVPIVIHAAWNGAQLVSMLIVSEG
jgi:membrane protease YdiL (CAAX protease family)